MKNQANIIDSNIDDIVHIETSERQHRVSRNNIENPTCDSGDIAENNSDEVGTNHDQMVEFHNQYPMLDQEARASKPTGQMSKVTVNNEELEANSKEEEWKSDNGESCQVNHENAATYTEDGVLACEVASTLYYASCANSEQEQTLHQTEPQTYTTQDSALEELCTQGNNMVRDTLCKTNDPTEDCSQKNDAQVGQQKHQPISHATMQSLPDELSEALEQIDEEPVQDKDIASTIDELSCSSATNSVLVQHATEYDKQIDHSEATGPSNRSEYDVSRHTEKKHFKRVSNMWSSRRKKFRHRSDNTDCSSNLVDSIDSKAGSQYDEVLV